jgi:hypothetical protein
VIGQSRKATARVSGSPQSLLREAAKRRHSIPGRRDPHGVKPRRGGTRFRVTTIRLR